MKLHAAKFLLIGFVLVWAACEIVDPFLIALNLPLEACGDINVGSTWNEDDTYNIRDEISNVSSDYVNNVKATRVNDINVYMPNPPATGTGSGTVQYALDGGSLVTLLTFTDVPFDSLRGNGISLKSAISNPGQVVFNMPAVNALLAALQDSTGLPATTTIRVVNNGSTTVTVPQGTQICARISYQVDVEI